MTMLSKPRSAFTLVEMMVVVAIVGLLVAMVIPGLGAVRATSRKTRCANNLKEIGQAVGSWAFENKGKLPPYDEHEAKPFLVPDPEALYDFTGTSTDYDGSAGGTADTWLNLGVLVRDEIVTTGEVFYSPDQPDEKYWLETYSPFPVADWTSGDPAQTDVVVSYAYNPEGRDPEPGGRQRKHWYIASMTGRDITLMDNLSQEIGTDANPVHMPHGDTYGWHVLWGDGSVSFPRNSLVVQALNGTHPDPTSNAEERHDLAIRLLLNPDG